MLLFTGRSGTRVRGHSRRQVSSLPWAEAWNLFALRICHAPTIRHRPRPAAPVVAAPAPANHGRNWAEPRELQIEYVATGDLTIPSRQLRDHTTKSLAKVAASLREFGVVHPLVVDARNEVVCGVARLLVMRDLGIARVPVVRVTHLSDLQLRAFRLADNKVAEGVRWNKANLAIELPELMLADFVEVTGFSTVGIEQITLGDPTKPANLEETEELAEPEPGPAIARLGDLFRIGEHLLICGNAREPATYEQLIGAEKARMVFGDLPYNVKIAGNVSGLGKKKHGEFVAGSGELSPDGLPSSWPALWPSWSRSVPTARSTSCAWTGVTSWR